MKQHVTEDLDSSDFDFEQVTSLTCNHLLPLLSVSWTTSFALLYSQTAHFQGKAAIPCSGISR